MKWRITIGWLFLCDILCLEGATMGAHGSMPHGDEVILTEDYNTGTAVLDSTSNQTINEDVEVHWEDGCEGLKQMVSAGMVTFS